MLDLLISSAARSVTELVAPPTLLFPLCSDWVEISSLTGLASEKLFEGALKYMQAAVCSYPMCPHSKLQGPQLARQLFDLVWKQFTRSPSTWNNLSAHILALGPKFRIRTNK